MSLPQYPKKMNPLKDEPFIVRLGVYRIFGIGVILGVALLFVLNQWVNMDLGIISSLVVILTCGIAGAIASLVWITVTFKYEPVQADYPTPVLLADFLTRPDAVIAPNLETFESDKLREWLLEFRSSQSEDSVWILPHPDDAGATDRVLLLVDDLTTQQKAILKGLYADSISVLDSKLRGEILPQIQDSRKLVEAWWD
jgi:hypothetical protein